MIWTWIFSSGIDFSTHYVLFAQYWLSITKAIKKLIPLYFSDEQNKSKPSTFSQI